MVVSVRLVLDVGRVKVKYLSSPLVIGVSEMGVPLRMVVIPVVISTYLRDTTVLVVAVYARSVRKYFPDEGEERMMDSVDADFVLFQVDVFVFRTKCLFC